MNIEYLFLPLCKLFEINGDALELIGVYRDKWHAVGYHLRLESTVVNSNGNTFAKLAALGLTREEAVVGA